MHGRQIILSVFMLMPISDPAINGTEVYVYRKYTQSYYLAQHILNAVVNIVGTKDNGVRANPSLYVLRRTNMPAVLVELAYLTNAGDAGKLETMQSEFARGIYEGDAQLFWHGPVIGA